MDRETFTDVFDNLWAAFLVFQQQPAGDPVNQSVEVGVMGLEEAMSLPGEWDDADIGLMRCVLRCDAFLKEWSAWRETFSSPVAGERGDVDGTRSMWDRLKEARSTLDNSLDLKPCESPIFLAETNNSVLNIAKIYEWKTPGGEWDVGKVNGELARVRANEPYEHWNDNYIAPSQLKRFDDIRTSFDEWQRERHEAHLTHIDESDPQTAPETVEELIGMRDMTMRQILKMKPDYTEVEVAAIALEMGVPLQGIDDVTAWGEPTERERVIESDKDQMVAEQSARSADQLVQDGRYGSVIDKIVSLKANGMRDGEIAESLQDEWAGLTTQRVTVILREANQQV